MSKQSIHVFAKWRVKAGHLDTVLELLPEVVRESSAEAGNLFYLVHRDHSDTNALLLFEGYRDQAALDDHRNSPHFQSIVVARIVPLLERREVSLATPLCV